MSQEAGTMTGSTELDEPQRTALAAVKAKPGSTAADIAPLIRIGQREGVSRGRALGVLSQLEDKGLVVRETGQRRVEWHLAAHELQG